MIGLLSSFSIVSRLGSKPNAMKRVGVFFHSGDVAMRSRAALSQKTTAAS